MCFFFFPWQEVDISMTAKRIARFFMILDFSSTSGELLISGKNILPEGDPFAIPL